MVSPEVALVVHVPPAHKKLPAGEGRGEERERDNIEKELGLMGERMKGWGQT